MDKEAFFHNSVGIGKKIWPKAAILITCLLSQSVSGSATCFDIHMYLEFSIVVRTIGGKGGVDIRGRRVLGGGAFGVDVGGWRVVGGGACSHVVQLHVPVLRRQVHPRILRT